MRLHPVNETCWKHTWGWHNQGCVWDKIATAWADEEWMSSKKKRIRKDNKDFVAFAFDHVKHSTVHRQGKEVKRNVTKKPPTEMNAIPPDFESPTILLQRDSYVATQWMN